MTVATVEQVLATPVDDMLASDETALRDILATLLAKVWIEDEGFDGKRPFGNSGWKNDIVAAMVKAGVLDGLLDEWGDLDEVDYDAADALILGAIDHVFQAVK